MSIGIGGSGGGMAVGGAMPLGKAGGLAGAKGAKPKGASAGGDIGRDGALSRGQGFSQRDTFQAASASASTSTSSKAPQRPPRQSEFDTQLAQQRADLVLKAALFYRQFIKEIQDTWKPTRA